MSRVLPTVVLALLVALAPAGCGESVEDRLATARAQQEDGQFEESIEPLREIVAEAPDHGEANYLLGYALMRTGRVAPAVWPLRKAAESEEFRKSAGTLLVYTLLTSANHEEARNVADEMLEKDPGNVEVLRLRAQAHLEAHHFEDMLADADRILELDPADGQGRQLRAVALTELERWDDAEAAFQAMREEADQSENAPLAARACLAVGKVREKRKDIAGAGKTLEGCIAGFAGDTLVLGEVADFYVRHDQPEKAAAIWRTAVAGSPDSLPLRLGLASQLTSAGALDEAKQVLRQAGEDFASAQAWEALAELLRVNREFDEADAVLQKVLASSPGSERLIFKRADVLIEAGKLDEAEALAKDLKEGGLGDLTRGRVLLQRGDAAGALERLEAGLEHWPNHAGARAAAGRAAQETGDFERAFEHYRQSIRADAKVTDAALAAAFLARALGRPQEAADYARYYVASRNPNDARAIVFAIESALEAGNEGQAAQFRALLDERANKGVPQAVAARAELDRTHESAATALKRIEEAKLDLSDPRNEPVLRARAELLVTQGRAAEALQGVDRALAAHPDLPELLDLRARLLAALGRRDEARASFERALAAKADYAPSLAGLGALEVQAGNLPGALEHFDRAVAANPSDAESAHRAAQIVLAQGDKAQAEQRLRALLARTPVLVGACNDLAWILAESGRDLDLALELAQRAVRLAPAPSADLADTLAFVQLARGDAKGAAESLEPALKQHPGSGLLRYRLGLARAQLGDSQAALEAFREALRDDSFKEAEDARAQIARLEGASATR
jgi:tetratricopeptide (TPR) repeat protein